MKPVALLVFAEEDCLPSLDEISALVRMRQIFQDVDILVLGIRAARSHEAGITYFEAPYAVKKKFAVRGLPTLFFIKGGIIEYRLEGFGPGFEEVIAEHLETLVMTTSAGVQ